MPLQTQLTDRDRDILRLLDRTAATTELLLKASVTFQGEPFRDVRRVRERLLTLAEAGLVRSFPASQGIGGPVHWHKLTREGFLLVRGVEQSVPHRSRFEATPPSRFAHTAALAEIIVHLTVAAFNRRVTIHTFHGDGELILEATESKQIPDCHFGLSYVGRTFNLLIEVDQSTEPLASDRLQSLRTKIRGYEAYQDSVWNSWKRNGEIGKHPYFRVVFLTQHAERASHILYVAREQARNPDRHLCLAGTQSDLLQSTNALFDPLVNDHRGRYQSLINPQPTSQWLRGPIRINAPASNTLSFFA